MTSRSRLMTPSTYRQICRRHSSNQACFANWSVKPLTSLPFCSRTPLPLLLHRVKIPRENSIRSIAHVYCCLDVKSPPYGSEQICFIFQLRTRLNACNTVSYLGPAASQLQKILCSSSVTVVYWIYQNHQSTEIDLLLLTSLCESVLLDC